ncbi:MAG: hypothetical protein E7376_04795 [Clostridiales bacterium]|nr:hypothetical protein [Clostridiales bacterium]
MKRKNFKIKFSLLFIILGLGILFFDSILNFIIYFIVVCMHELAHAFIAKKLGYKLGKLYIMPYGVCLNYENNIFGGSDEIYISIAGPLVNVLFCILCVTVWWLFPITYYYLDYFCFCNLLLASFNFLPCFPLDGGRVFVALLSKKIDREKAIKISYLCNYVLCSVLIILFIISLFNQINFTYIFIAIFLFTGTINPKKYSNYDYLSLNVNRNKLFKKGANVKIFAISSQVPIYKILAKFSKFKFNIVYIIFNTGAVKVLSENNINNLALKYSPTLNLEQITCIKN